MAAVVLVSLDLCGLRWLVKEGWVFRGQEPMVGALISPLMLNVQAVVGLELILDLRRRGACGAFRLGFLVFGFGAVLLFTIAAAIFRESLLDPLLELLLARIELALDSLDGIMSYEMEIAVVVVLFSLLFLLPQIVVALAGGYLNRCFGGFVIVRRLERAGSVESALTGKPM
jgi:hypothetical protein